MEMNGKRKKSNLNFLKIMKSLLTSSLMIKLGRRPDESSGGMSDPRRLDGPEPGANDPLRSGSRITSILGASGAIVGALISGTFASLFRYKKT